MRSCRLFGASRGHWRFATVVSAADSRPMPSRHAPRASVATDQSRAAVDIADRRPTTLLPAVAYPMDGPLAASVCCRGGGSAIGAPLHTLPCANDNVKSLHLVLVRPVVQHVVCRPHHPSKDQRHPNEN